MATQRQAKYRRVSEDAPFPEHSERIPRNQPGSKWDWIWRGITAVMCVFFLMSAYVQLNDPDPYIWIPVYAGAAFLCAPIVWKPNCVDNSVWKILCTVHIGCCVLGAIYTLAILIEMMTGKIYNPLRDEEGRELAGLIITILWLCACRFSSIGSSDPYRWNTNGLLLVLAIVGLLPLVLWALCFVERMHSHLAHCTGMFPGLLGSGHATS